ncbi:hypothetical protein DY000_02032345 [Brassica cretica]|uniref:Uncharacterized protein n=1 Tax=Brassica cretica TaxID=69181 RepID=A0ABQ7DTP0_BRACR|nr:hypothetical protein DY000_02032345 [Brassica cretica]
MLHFLHLAPLLEPQHLILLESQHLILMASHLDHELLSSLQTFGPVDRRMYPTDFEDNLRKKEICGSFCEVQELNALIPFWQLSSQALQLTSQVLQLTSQVLQLTSASCQQSRNSLRPLSASSSFYKSQRWGLEIDLIKRSTLGSGQRDLIGLKRSQTDDGLNLRAGTSYSSWKDAYAMSFKFPGYTSFSNDGKAYVHCYSEVCLGRDLSFSEDMFTKNDSYKGLCRSYALHLGWVNSNWVQYECKIQDARWVAADSEKETLRCKYALRVERAKNQEIYLIRKISIN